MYREWAPDSRLAGRVTCVWSREATSAMTQLVVPDGCVDLIWGPGGAQVAGPDTGPKPVRLAPGDRYTGVRFGPGAAGELFGVPLDSLRDLRVPLSDLGSFAELSELEPLATPPGPEASTGPAGAWAPDPLSEAVRRALAVQLRAAPGPDPAAHAIAEALRAGRSVREVAWDLGFGERQLLRRSLRAFGYGPKVLQRVVRFQRALWLARRGVTAAEVAVVSGYADQAHMANEVRRLAGVSLGRLLDPPGDGTG
ncbi:AraC family transcriptional regulator [Streptosporangium sp. NPDC048865]|uniref:AraC family transcriptional regulator n=1 Tax=Streptosporangium sp. NPDC048865 TaxID=3155766 RepID=UPI00341ED0A5